MKGIPISIDKAAIHCRIFEDNSGAIEMAKVPKMRPRTKHLNIKLHHFRDYITRGDIKIQAIDTTNQLANYLTKLVNKNTLTYLRKKVMGW